MQCVCFRRLASQANVFVLPCSYCKNLDFAQQQSAPFTPGQYVDYDCVLPLGSLLWILFAEASAHISWECTRSKLRTIKHSNIHFIPRGLHASLACALLRLTQSLTILPVLSSIWYVAFRSVTCFGVVH
jgi:hypothetical protein